MTKENYITPRYSCMFVSRFCPRHCGYCLAKDIKGEGKVLSPAEWAKALHILEDQGVVFHLILGNELFAYPDPVGLVKALKPFYGRYAMYSTFPEPWTRKKIDAVIEAGLYNISGGVDVWPGIRTGDSSVDGKANAVLQRLVECKAMGVPDVHATVTIHKHNYDKLEPLLSLCTKEGIWAALNMIEYSSDGKHDFYGTKETMKNWLIPEDEREKFRDHMYSLAAKIRAGRWMIQVPPAYFEELGDAEVEQKPWHCSDPLIIHLEEDGMLRACSYRGPLGEKRSVFELGDGRMTMNEYVKLQQVKTKQCPGCSGGGGGWSYWWQAEYWQKGDLEFGDKVFQIHTPGYEFEKTIKKDTK